ncbi:lactamase_B domain-containing protein [Trichonephila clavata]|uniref:Lactamase_B domain-containing protein n=1 Tax=Trichonephila clavata TaxID=2740835 RepID=A0A8X6LMC2_TRICU|nr:lactamase_B domain-containing protein [Trichonephila clavata]
MVSLALGDSYEVKMKNIIIAGSGPVGSFMAVLCAQLGFPVTVYEKRPEFTRNINVKLEGNFFREVQEVLSRLNVKTEFFGKLNEHLHSQRNRILIKELEERFAREAKSLGARYITREVESFEELYEEHKASDPIILDCTGRNSKLRINKFGSDKDNIVSAPLQHAMYVNFKAKITDNMSSLYQVMKYMRNIKLTEVVLSKRKDKDGFSDVTLPVFITDELARVFDKEYPNISREPLNPFNSSRLVPDSIFFPISSLLGNLIVDGCNVDLNSVKVKKIEISCGYAKERSKDNYICLGDSAIHLAFFRSLNLGLKHALEFFIKLSMLQPNVQTPKDDEIIKKFKEHYPHLHPVRVHPTVARNVFLVVTKVIWYGCFSYCLTNHERERLTNRSGVYKDQVVNILNELNQKLSTWSNSLADFEAKRDGDIKNEIHSNKTKSVLYDYLSWFIDINGKSFIKISELARAARGKYSLYPKDFKFLLECFKVRREAIATNVISSLLNQLKGKEFDQLKKVCAKEDLSDEEKMKLIGDAANTLIKNEIAQIQKLSSEPDPTLDNASSEPVAVCIILLAATSATVLLMAGIVKPKTSYIIVAGTIFIAVAFVAWHVTHKSSNEMEGKMYQVNDGYINELQEKFSDINFKRLEKIEGTYVTNPENRSTYNDSRIFKETQVKRTLSSVCAPFVSEAVKSKLSYFSQKEDKDQIYKLDNAQDLQPGERYAIQNIGHATQLIQVPGFNILTDPVFNNLSKLLYPEKTISHPSIEELPKIDVIIISHNHRDHVDRRSLQKLLEHYETKHWPQPKVFVPMGDKKLFENFGFNQIEEVEWYTKISVIKDIDGTNKTVNFVSIPADHRSGRHGIDHHKSLVTGWVINPEQEDVIFKFSGDTKSLTDENQQATDAVLWNEIRHKKVNQGKNDENIEVPDIICLEPSGPNYTRCDMDITHQSTSYSALLKFIEAKNLAKLSGKSPQEFLEKIQTVMMHHNKFELGPDRFNEGLFVLKKLIKYLDLNEEDLNREFARQKEKLEQNLDKERLKENTPFTSRPIIATLPKQTSLLVRAKDFIIEEIKKVTEKLENIDKEQMKGYLIGNTIFPKIGERLNDEQVENSRFDVESVQKYNGGLAR